MKKITVINNETCEVFHYSGFAWKLAWTIVFVMGIILGATLF